MKNVESQGRRRIALGLEDYLDEFARRHDAKKWNQFAESDPANWKYYFLGEMDDVNVAVYFNLTGVDVQAGILRAARGAGGPTDWELLEIQQHDVWWPRIIWVRDGVSVSNPFEPEVAP